MFCLGFFELKFDVVVVSWGFRLPPPIVWELAEGEDICGGWNSPEFWSQHLIKLSNITVQNCRILHSFTFGSFSQHSISPELPMYMWGGLFYHFGEANMCFSSLGECHKPVQCAFPSHNSSTLPPKNIPKIRRDHCAFAQWSLANGQYRLFTLGAPRRVV